MRFFLSFLLVISFISCTRVNKPSTNENVSPDNKTSEIPQKINSNTPIKHDITNNDSLFYILENKYIAICLGDFYHIVDDEYYYDYKEYSFSFYPFSAKRKIKKDLVSKEISKYIGMTFITQGKDHQDVQITITDILLYAKYYPNSFEIMSWNKEELSSSEIDKCIWEENENLKNDILVVGLLDKVVESSEIATPLNVSKPIYFEEINETPIDDINRICKNTTEYIEYISKLDKVTNKEDYEIDYKITGYRNPITNEFFFLASIYTGKRIGGDLFFDSIFLVNQKQDDFNILTQYKNLYNYPLLVFDINGDNLPELLYNLPLHRYERTIVSSDKPFTSIPVEYYECGF